MASNELTCSLSWCLPVGLTSPLPYYYIVFFVVLLVHRQRRDDEACKQKYGKDWDRYCGLVPWRIIPWVVGASLLPCALES